MTPFWLPFIIGLILGCFGGLFLAGILGAAGAAARQAEYLAELHRLKRKYPHVKS